jgi:hypothetical protein
LHYEEFKKKCLAFGNPDPKATTLTINYNFVIRPDLSKGHVLSLPLAKIFRPMIRKGILGEDHQIYEFGYCKRLDQQTLMTINYSPVKKLRVIQY